METLPLGSIEVDSAVTAISLGWLTNFGRKVGLGYLKLWDFPGDQLELLAFR